MAAARRDPVLVCTDHFKKWYWQQSSLLSKGAICSIKHSVLRKRNLLYTIYTRDSCHSRGNRGFNTAGICCQMEWGTRIVEPPYWWERDNQLEGNHHHNAHKDDWISINQTTSKMNPRSKNGSS